MKCFNEPGGFTCDCPAGYDGTPCVVGHSDAVKLKTMYYFILGNQLILLFLNLFQPLGC